MTAPTPDAGPVMWITGAGSGVGRAVAVAAAHAGWRLALSGRREDALAGTAELAGLSDERALLAPVDVTDRSLRDVVALIDTRWGRLDAVVTSAGWNVPTRRWDDADPEEMNRVVDVNLGGTIRTLAAARASLITSRGAGVVISSRSAWRFAPGAGAAYAASKAGLGEVVASFNAETAEHGVRASVVCPGDIDTGFLEHRPAPPGAGERTAMLTPADVARAVMFVLDTPAHVRVDELVLNPAGQP